MNIKKVIGREILDSRGNFTTEADIVLDNNITARASSPKGASTGAREAHELKDTKKAVNNINTIINKKLKGINVFDQKKIDDILIETDGTDNKSKLGANSIIATSIACLKAASKEYNIPLYKYISDNIYEPQIPKPVINIINGGYHADNDLDIQEFMIIPIKDTIYENITIAKKIHKNLKEILKKKYYNTNVGDEGGFAPNIKSSTEAFDLILEAIKESKYEPLKDVVLGIDAAASTFYKDGKYNYEDKILTSEELNMIYQDYIDKYYIRYIEDPFDEEDYSAFKELTESVNSDVLIVGDDLYTTNIEELRKNLGITNAILIKPNQIGTITETLECIRYAKDNNIEIIVSHRSGDTEDPFIASLAVGVASKYIKTGCITRGERTCKYNQLLRIEEELKGL